MVWYKKEKQGLSFPHSYEYLYCGGGKLLEKCGKMSYTIQRI